MYRHSCCRCDVISSLPRDYSIGDIPIEPILETTPLKCVRGMTEYCVGPALFVPKHKTSARVHITRENMCNIYKFITYSSCC